MPPRIRTRACKTLKENIDVTENKLKRIKSKVVNTEESRKPLADKTNSASDDASLEIPTKTKKTNTKTSKSVQNENGENKQNCETKRKTNVMKPKQRALQKENTEPMNDMRPRRDRRLPTRFVENTVLINLCNSKESINDAQNNSIINSKVSESTPAKNKTLPKSDEQEPSPFKTPAKGDSSLLASRPRRICRLPSRFDDHSISPNKCIPIKPANASTPIQTSKTKQPLNAKETVINKTSKDTGKKQTVERPTRLAKIYALQKKSSDKSSDKSSPDSNNNAKSRSTRNKTNKAQQSVNKKQNKNNQSPMRKFLTPINKNNQLSLNKLQSPLYKTQSPVNKNNTKESANTKRIIDKNLSFKLLGGINSQEKDNKNEDVYEFTFDPDEEPKPQKKKSKRTVTKKPNPSYKSKVVYKSSYDKNISKALAALKNAIKPGKPTEGPKLTTITENNGEAADTSEQNNLSTVQNNLSTVQNNLSTVQNNLSTEQNTNVNKENNIALNDTGKTSVHECNYPSIRVEDIAADIEPSMDHHDDVNYSPVNSPRPIQGSKTPNASINLRESPEKNVHNNDPLNLQEELSFFDDACLQPVASSSMNMSVRHPLASPWRVEFGSLPIKWHVNTYVKPNMTPAVESSFISAEDLGKKKHVYTNMLPQTNDMFPENDDTPNLKQTSIISFIKEMAEKSAKKKRGRSVSPIKAIYEEIGDANVKTNKNKKPSKKATTRSNNTSEEVTSSENNTSNEKENSKEESKSRKRKNDGNLCDIPAKSPRKQKDKDCTYFGFDETDNQDIENVSPTKINNPSGRSLRPRSRVVLQEINGPTRAALPVAAKTKIATSSEAVNKVYEELKSAADAPLFPENNVDNNETNIENPTINEDSQSVHLFEDIEVVHHLKPTRKSYGKAKKVTFRQLSTSDSDSVEGVVAEQNESSDYDDLGDLTFEIPGVKEKKTIKKRKPRNLMTKKEEQEAEQWAANFNSMCEDVEEFPLLVE